MIFQQYSGSHKLISIQFRLKFTVGISHHIINHSLLLSLAQGLLGSTCLCLFPEVQFCTFLGRVTSLPKLHRGWWNNLACACPPKKYIANDKNVWCQTGEGQNGSSDKIISIREKNSSVGFFSQPPIQCSEELPCKCPLLLCSVTP